MFELQTITGKNRDDIYLKRWRILGYLSPDDNYKGKPIESLLPFTQNARYLEGKQAGTIGFLFYFTTALKE